MRFINRFAEMGRLDRLRSKARGSRFSPLWIKSKGFPPVDRSQGAVLYGALFIPEKPKRVSLPPHTRLVGAEEVIAALK